MNAKLKKLAASIYAYHNLGTGIFPEGEEKTPHGGGERYNFDRMYMMVSNYDFTNKNVIDLGCNSGWFCVQAKLLGADAVVGVDHAGAGMMGQAIRYAIEFEKCFRLGLRFIDQNLESVDCANLARQAGVPQFDVALLLSTLHHIHDKRRLFAALYDATREVIFYEDHEFWNDLVDAQGRPIAVKGTGYRYGWNEDMSWQRKIASLESYEPGILMHYRATWRNETLMLNRFAEIRFLGFSEKRRPVLALIKARR